MHVATKAIAALELRYNGPPPPCALRYARYGAAGYQARRNVSECTFLNKEASKAVFAIARQRSRTKTPSTNPRLGLLTRDLEALRKKAIAGTDWRRFRHTL
ncbi:MAG: hypothetical protein JKY20_04045 [Alphaproteobacteria bacterium]|nr:hypothetical protein [Alphaproteobacteria bacterium]